MKTQEETVTFHCLTEENEWEGETWYHYFLDEPGVLNVLTYLIEKDQEEGFDFVELETCSLTWTEATRLTNLDTGGYMQEHWFGQLTKPEELKVTDSQVLYKGGIRDFGEELFTYELGPDDELTESINESKE